MDRLRNAPVELADCPECKGRGLITTSKVHEDGYVSHSHKSCAACNGTGSVARETEFFSELPAQVTASCDGDGWLTCPYCHWRFSVHNSLIWRNGTHGKCGYSYEVSYPDGTIADSAVGPPLLVPPRDGAEKGC